MTQGKNTSRLMISTNWYPFVGRQSKICEPACAHCGLWLRNTAPRTGKNMHPRQGIENWELHIEKIYAPRTGNCILDKCIEDVDTIAIEQPLYRDFLSGLTIVVGPIYPQRAKNKDGALSMAI